MSKSCPDPYKGHRFPREIISYAVWLYHRLSLRDVEGFLAYRGIETSYETVRDWEGKFDPLFAEAIRRNRPRAGDKWHLDEVVIKINGEIFYLWRAVDQHGDVLDIMVQKRRNKKAAKRFCEQAGQAIRPASGDDHRQASKLWDRQERGPARCRAPSAQRVEQPGRDITQADPATRTGYAAVQVTASCSAICATHDQINTLFRSYRYHLSRAGYRHTRNEASALWADVTNELTAA